MKQEIAKDLLDIQAVLLQPNQPFTWASGIKSPIYCDNRLTLSYPNVRRHIEQQLAHLIKEKFPEVACIAGTATAGIPHAALVADIMDLPMIYIRSSAKDHGRQNQIEGQLTEGEKIVVLDDLISTGGSVLDAVTAAREVGAEVLGVISIFTYELSASFNNFRQANVSFYSLTDFSTLIEVAEREGYIHHADVEKLKRWQQDPTKAYQ